MNDALRAARNALALRRAILADKAYPALLRDWDHALTQQVQDVADLALHEKPPSIPDEMQARWLAESKRLQRAHLLALTAHGWKFAGDEITVAQSIEGKSLIVTDFDSFVQRGNLSTVQRWIQTTADSSTATSGERLLNIFNTQLNYIDPETKRGLTPLDVAKMILQEGLAQTESRAEMLAHTGAIWAANEGAVLRYQSDGIAACRWLTAEDDLRCPFCFAMDGKLVSPGDPFLQSGDTLDLGDVGLMKIPKGIRGFDVRHPPLHPNCRCTVVPIVDERQLI